ncbi:CoA-transferase family III domain-containing protein [Cyathus striatus]|nr:CoA-transferase family III domain-containing protein [Cyathus striatus]
MSIANLWQSVGLPDEALKRLHLEGDPDRAVDSSFLLGTAAQVSVGLSGLSAARLHGLRTGLEQDVTVDARHAALAFRMSFMYFMLQTRILFDFVDTEAFYTTNVDVTRTLWDSIAGLYKTKDNSYVRIHTNFPQYEKTLSLLSSKYLNLSQPPSRYLEYSEHRRHQRCHPQEVQAALSQWDSVEFETEAANRGMCATAMRFFEQWDRHPHSKALAGVPPVEIRKIGDAPKRVISPGKRPLEGIKALDLSRVLAGPACGRALAAHGADVLLVTSPNLPSLPNFDIETSLGKQDKGFGVQELAKLRPGIVCANLRAWGWNGPWEGRRGFDSLVQTATGFNYAEGEAYQIFQGEQNIDVRPRPFPMQAIDFAAGYLLVFGISAALCKTITEGGSWEVRVSLTAVGQWIRSLGRNLDGFSIGRPFPKAGEQEVEELLWIRALKHPAVLSLTPVREGGEDGIAALKLDAHDPVWIETS